MTDVIEQRDDDARTTVGPRIEDYLNRSVHTSLRPVLAGIALVFVVFTTVNLLGYSLPEYEFFSIFVFDCLVLTLTAGLFLIHRLGLIPVRASHTVAVSVVLALQANALFTLWITGQPQYTTYVAIVMIGTSAVLLSPLSMVVVIGCSVVGWAVAAVRVASDPNFLYFPLFMMAAAVMAVVVHRSRYTNMIHIYQLRRADEESGARLALALASSEGRHRQIVETANEGIGITDRRGVIVYANPRIHEMLGFADGELVGTPYLDIIDPDDRETVAHLTAGREESGNESYETRFLHRDGSPVWCRVSASPLYDEDGAFIGGLGLMTDISASKRAMETVRRSEKHYRTLFEGAFDAIILFDPEDEVILDVNRHACELYGFERSEFIGMSLRAITKDVERGKRHVQTALESSGHHRLETVHFRKDGSELLIDANGSVIDYEGRKALLTINREITEHRKLEQEIRAQRDFQQTVLNALSHPFYVIDADTYTVLLANKASGFAAKVGRTTCHDLTYDLPKPCSGEDLPCPVDQVKKTGRPATVEHVRHDEAGAETFHEVHAHPIFDDNGLVTKIIKYTIDITERKVVEKARERYSQRLEALQEINRAILAAESPPAIARAVLYRVLDLIPVDGACVLLNEPENDQVSVLRITAQGLEESQMSGGDFQKCRRCWEDDDCLAAQTVENCAVAAGFAPEATRSLACEPLLVDGEHMGVFALLSSRPTAFVSEHRQIARELADRLALSLRQAKLWQDAESERHRFKAIVEHLPEAVIVLARDRRVLFANTAGKEQLALLAEIAIGEILSSLGGESLEKLFKASDRGERLALTVDGERTRHFEATAARLTASGGPGGFVVVLRDVTRDKEVQEHVLGQQRLAAVGQLASGIAHDFNNILQIILMNGEMLRQAFPGPADKLDNVNTIIQQTKRASTLVRQILDFSRKSVRAGKALNLARLVTETIQLLERTIREQVLLTCTIEDDARDLVVRGDAAQLQQLITNLAINAQDAMPRGGDIRISLTCLTLAADDRPPFPGMPAGSWAALEVADTGTGMPAEVKARIYEPFFTTKGPGKGTGLGLAQVYGIVKQHDGFIDLTSAVGRGTTFHIYLPVIAEAQDDSDTGAHRAIGRGRKEVIVVVEDEELLLDSIKTALKSFGYDVHAHGDVDEAILACEKLGDRVSIVLSDIVMPKHSGPELLERIRPLCPTARFILMSGYPLDEFLGDDSASRDIDYLKKPFSIQTLIEAVNQALETE